MFRRKRWMVGLALVIVLVLIAGLWLRPRLQRHAAAVALRHLEESYEGKVTVGSIAFGLSGIELRDVRFWELTEVEAPPSVWLTLQRVRIQFPLWQAFYESPQFEVIRVEGAMATLRLDATGQLATQLPPPTDTEIPAERIIFGDLRLELQSPGRSPFVIDEVSAELIRTSQGLEGSGRIGDLLGGIWTFHGQSDHSMEHATLRIASEQLDLNWSELRELPFVPDGLPAELENLRANAQVRLEWEIARAPDLALQHEGRVVLQSLDLEFTDRQLAMRGWTGELRVHENRWELSELEGEIFGGKLKLAGEFHMDESPRRLSLDVDLDRLEVTRLASVVPQIPADLAGLAVGKFHMEVEFRTPWSASGSGSVNVVEASWRDLPADNVELTLQLDRWQYDVATDSFLPPEGTLLARTGCQELSLEDAIRHFPWEREELQALTGLVTATVSAVIPLASLDDPTNYQADGEFQLSSIRWSAVDWSELTGSWDWREGTVSVENLRGTGTHGERLTGFGRFPLEPDGAMIAQLELEELPLGPWSMAAASLLPREIQDAASELLSQLDGDVSAEASLSVPISTWQDPDTWTGEGSFRSDRLQAHGVDVEQPAVRWRLRQQVLELLDIQGQWENVSVLGNAEIDFAAPCPFRVTIELPEFDGAQLAESAEFSIPWDWEGRVEVSGAVHGQLVPLMWSAVGEGRIHDFQMPDIGWTAEIPFALAADEQEASLTVDRIPIWGGEMEVDGRLSLTGDRASQLVVRLHEIDSSQLADERFPLPEIPRGLLSGELEVTGLPQLDSLSARGLMTSDRLDLGPLRIEQLTSEVQFRDGVVEVQAKGNALRGEVRLVAHTPFAVESTRPWEKLDFSGTVTLENARLEEVVRRLGREEAERLRELSGQMTGEWLVSWNAWDAVPEARGRGILRNVRWGRDELLQTAEADLRIDATSCEVRNLNARLGRGLITGQIRFPLSDGGRGTFNLNATRLEFRRILAPWPDVARQLEGTLDSRIRGQLDSTWRGSADCLISRARWAGVEVRGMRLPVEWTYSPARRRATARVRETTLRIAQGRGVVRGELRWDRELEMEGQARLSSINLRTLMRGVASSASVPSGRLDGRLEFSGNRIRSMNDLRGSFVGTLGEAQVLRLPVMESLVPALGGGQPSTSSVGSSDIQLSLARGRLEVERLAFASSAVQLLVTGEATLEGRLDLDVTAHLGQINTRTPLARALRASLLVAAPPVQIALLTQANDWLTNQLIFLRVGGTFRSPSVQLRPAATVGNEALRFFLEGVTGVPTGFPQPEGVR